MIVSGPESSLFPSWGSSGSAAGWAALPVVGPESVAGSGPESVEGSGPESMVGPGPERPRAGVRDGLLAGVRGWLPVDSMSSRVISVSRLGQFWWCCRLGTLAPMVALVA